MTLRPDLRNKRPIAMDSTKSEAPKLPCHRFSHENSARTQGRGVNEVLHFVDHVEILMPGVEVMGWCEAHAAGFDDPMYYEGMPERKLLMLVGFPDGPEAWFHTNGIESVRFAGRPTKPLA